jgi:hypothetical protein
MATGWHIQKLEQGYEPAFINMVGVRGSFAGAVHGQQSGDELKYGAKDGSQHAIVAGRGLFT